MNVKDIHPIERMARRYACPWCSAQPGHPCHTIAGRIRHQSHGQRSTLIPAARLPITRSKP